MTSSGHADLERQRNVKCREVASDGTENLGVGFLYGANRPGNDFELIPTVKMETRHHVYIGITWVMNFRRSIITAELWQPEIARR